MARTRRPRRLSRELPGLRAAWDAHWPITDAGDCAVDPVWADVIGDDKLAEKTAAWLRDRLGDGISSRLSAHLRNWWFYTGAVVNGHEYKVLYQDDTGVVITDVNSTDGYVFVGAFLWEARPPGPYPVGPRPEPTGPRIRRLPRSCTCETIGEDDLPHPPSPSCPEHAWMFELAKPKPPEVQAAPFLRTVFCTTIPTGEKVHVGLCPSAGHAGHTVKTLCGLRQEFDTMKTRGQIGRLRRLCIRCRRLMQAVG
jgi:hypothetical protein